MIYTVTFNPSLDYIVGVDEFKTGKVNRTAEELILPGGKGINVSIVLKNLGMESIPLGFAGGFTGEEIHRLLKERKVEEQFVRVKKGISRINVKLRSVEKNWKFFISSWMLCKKGTSLFLPEVFRRFFHLRSTVIL